MHHSSLLNGGKNEEKTDRASHADCYKIFSQGDPAENVLYIQQGRVKVKVISKQGKEAIIAILGAGEFLGDRLSAWRWLRRWYLANLALYFEL